VPLKYLQIRSFSSPFLFVAPEDHVPRRTLLGSSVMKRRGPFKLLQHVGLLVPIVGQATLLGKVIRAFLGV
jgi:hypothetical protein